MQIPKRKIQQSLLRKGFVRRQGDHEYFYHVYQGKETGVFTKISRGSSKYKDYGPHLLRLMKQELRLDTMEELLRLLRCPMDGEEYLTVLKGKGLLPD